jgi:hypothetical protein
VAEGSAITFMPTADELKDSIEDSIMKGIAVVCNNELLISSPEFEVYINALEDAEDRQFEEEIDLLQMVINDSAFKGVNGKIKTAIDSAFVRLAEYSVVFTPFLEVYQENEDTDFDRFNSVELEEFKRAIEKYKA